MLMRNRGLFTGIACGFLAFAVTFTGVLRTVDKVVEDRLYHHAGNIDTRIKIIKIDDRTMNQMGDFSTWDRGVYADLVETICVSDEIRPAVIGFDILFSSNKLQESDTRFAQVCENYGNVITGSSYVFAKQVQVQEDGSLGVDYMSVSEKVMPYAELKEATKQGFVNALTDDDDKIIRSSFLYFVEEDGGKNKSFSSAIYEAYMDSVGQTASYPTDNNGMYFRYTGKAGEYENVSLVDVLNGTVPAEAFDDCIVLVGAYAAGMLDAYYVPVDQGKQMYGVEVHANVIQALLEGKILNRWPASMDALFAAIWIFLLVLICDKASPKKIVAVCLGSATAKLMLGYLLFVLGFSTNVLVIPIFSILIAVYYIGVHYYKASAAKRSIERAFRKYVAPQVVKEIAKDGSYELKLGGENRDVAVLFVDIRGFTSLSESLEPEQVVDILNGYLKLTTESIFRHGGTLDKFIGDATMAVFNSPFDTEDYEYKAILAAWDIVQGGNRIEKEFLEKYGKQVGFGVGVNCGPAVVGNIGCDFRMDYTAIGDTVNTAARLESNAPRGCIYISETLYERLKGRITVEEVGEIPLKGKSKGVFVYSVIGVDGDRSSQEK